MTLIQNLLIIATNGKVAGQTALRASLRRTFIFINFLLQSHTQTLSKPAVDSDLATNPLDWLASTLQGAILFQPLAKAGRGWNCGC